MFIYASLSVDFLLFLLILCKCIDIEELKKMSSRKHQDVLNASINNILIIFFRCYYTRTLFLDLLGSIMKKAENPYAWFTVRAVVKFHDFSDHVTPFNDVTFQLCMSNKNC
jgi:hypothetical protein